MKRTATFTCERKRYRSTSAAARERMRAMRGFAEFEWSRASRAATSGVQKGEGGAHPPFCKTNQTIRFACSANTLSRASRSAPSVSRSLSAPAGHLPRFAGEEPVAAGSSPAERGRGTMRSMVEGPPPPISRGSNGNVATALPGGEGMDSGETSRCGRAVGGHKM